MIPSFHDITYFMEVAQTKNISRAAERLGISQPSLTLAVQRLEHAIGAPLLIRSKKGVNLSQAGKQLMLHSRDLIQRWESVKSQALASTNEVQGSYAFGCHVSVALYSLPGFIADLQEAHPKLEIRLIHDLSRKICEQVIQMELDLAIVVNPVKHPDLMIRKLRDDEVTFWVGRGHRSVQNYESGEATLICEPDLLQTQSLLRKMKAAGIGYRRIISSSSLEVVTELTVSGAGVGIIPGGVAGRAEDKGLRRIPRAPTFADEICLIYRMENKNLKTIQTISEFVNRAFQKA